MSRQDYIWNRSWGVRLHLVQIRATAYLGQKFGRDRIWTRFHFEQLRHLIWDSGSNFIWDIRKKPMGAMKATKTIIRRYKIGQTDLRVRDKLSKE